MRGTRLSLLAGLALLLLGAAPLQAAPTAEDRCASRMAEASGRYLDCAMRENGRAAKRGRAANLDRCERKLGRVVARAQALWGPACPDVNAIGGEATTLGDQLSGLVSEMSEAVGVSDEGLSRAGAKCAAQKAKVLGQDLRCRALALARGARWDRAPNEEACSERRLARKLARIEKRYGAACPTRGDAGMLAARGQQALSEVTDWVAPSIGNYAGTIDPLPLERLPDADGDGLPDNFELGISLTNPTLADTDGDGRGDGLEVIHHATKPNIPDVAPQRVSGSSEATKYQKDHRTYFRTVGPKTPPGTPQSRSGWLNEDGSLSSDAAYLTGPQQVRRGSWSVSEPISLAGDDEGLTDEFELSVKDDHIQPEDFWGRTGSLPGGDIPSAEPELGLGSASESVGAAATAEVGMGVLGGTWLLFGAVAQITGFVCEFANCNNHYDPVPGLLGELGGDLKGIMASLDNMDETFEHDFTIVEQLENQILEALGAQAALATCKQKRDAFHRRFPKLDATCPAEPPTSGTSTSQTYHSPACAFQRFKSNFTSTAPTAVLAEYFKGKNDGVSTSVPGLFSYTLQPDTPEQNISHINVNLDFMEALAPQYMETPSPALSYREMIHEINQACGEAIEASNIGSADGNELGSDAVFYNALAKFVHEPLGNYRALASGLVSRG
jgi:hypothetical protein